MKVDGEHNQEKIRLFDVTESCQSRLQHSGKAKEDTACLLYSWIRELLWQKHSGTPAIF
jgi:hypothetical protein